MATEVHRTEFLNYTQLQKDHNVTYVYIYLCHAPALPFPILFKVMFQGLLCLKSTFSYYTYKCSIGRQGINILKKFA